MVCVQDENLKERQAVEEKLLIRDPGFLPPGSSLWLRRCGRTARAKRKGQHASKAARETAIGNLPKIRER